MQNPFKPGAGHPPPFLAGREAETQEFSRILDQSVVLENVVLTGLRGVGKTVLLDTCYRDEAIKKGWLWANTDLSESSSVSEESLAVRILTDLSILTSGIIIGRKEKKSAGFLPETALEPVHLNFNVLKRKFDETPGLMSDRLKSVLEFVALVLNAAGIRGVIFAYDEAQNLSDRASKEQYPLSMLLDVFQSIQKKGINFILVLTGLPTLFPKLVEARTFSERMFRVITLSRLTPEASKEAICRPIEDQNCPIKLSVQSVNIIVELSAGYPYFIQFICREVYDSFLQVDSGEQPRSVPVGEILRKLDTDFFAGRWNRATDRQRELLAVASSLDTAEDEFTVQEVADLSREMLSNPFSNSQINQMFSKLSDAGLIYKNRHGKYCFAVPLMADFIKRQLQDSPLFDWQSDS